MAQIDVRKVWTMLDHCAPDDDGSPGYAVSPTKHKLEISYQGETFYYFPKGPGKDQPIYDVHFKWIKKLARTLKIEECAKTQLPQCF